MQHVSQVLGHRPPNTHKRFCRVATSQNPNHSATSTLLSSKEARMLTHWRLQVQEQSTVAVEQAPTATVHAARAPREHCSNAWCLNQVSNLGEGQ